MLSVFIIDNSIGFRDHLANLLNSQPDFEVVGQTGCAGDAMALVKKLHPDLILMDFNLPDRDSLQVAREILSFSPQAVIVFLSGQEDDERMVAAIRSGAKGYLRKSLAPPQLLASLRGLREGQAPISRTMVTRLLEELSHSNNHHPDEGFALDRLTPRELDVLHELVKGGSNREIASRLYISEYTVKNHIHSILHKLEVASRREAIKFAQNYGMVGR